MTARRPGWDAAAINRIAVEFYGGLLELFEQSGWPERGTRMMPAVLRHVHNAYGTVEAFVREHEAIGGGNRLLYPGFQIGSGKAQVWLTSMYGFEPEDWGLLPFTLEAHLRTFLSRTRPGELCVVYGGPKAPAAMRRRVIGILQFSHEVLPARSMMSLQAWTDKQSDPATAKKWNYAVRILRAWRVTPETYMHIEDFAPDTAARKSWRSIGALGVTLSSKEVQNILKLDLQECTVFGGPTIIGAEPVEARKALAPSKAGPVSQNPYTVRESEGPKHLYILGLKGNADHFLGRKADGKLIVKPGFSKSPGTRCADHNRHLPACAFEWEILYSGPLSGLAPYPTSAHAKAGERAMQTALLEGSKDASLGGEFFLTTENLVKAAWKTGNAAARKFKG